MQNRPRRISLALGSLVVANFMPICGGLFLSWDLHVILVLYWAENVIIGIYNALKMAIVQGGGAGVKKLTMIPFFIVHFGVFCAVHGMFVFCFFASGWLGENEVFDGTFSPPGLRWGLPNSSILPFPLTVFEALFGLAVNAVQWIWFRFGWSGVVPLIGLFTSHGISFVQNFIGKGEFKSASVELQMFKPYGRVVIMHFAIILAAVPVLLLGSPFPLLLLLVVLKTAVDVVVHQWSHSSGESVPLLEEFWKMLKGPVGD
jgi:hypothetical protein